MDFGNFISDPWGTLFQPWTDLFNKALGNGEVFYLFPFIILTFGIWYKTQSPIMATTFMLVVGSLISSGSFYVGASSLGAVFTVFTAIGLTALIISLIFQR